MDIGYVSEEVAMVNSKGKNPKKKWKCYNCGEAGHLAADCKKPKKKQEAPASK